MEKRSPLLELDGITKRFGGVTALDNVRFDLHAGEIHALVGENGAGKSTLIKILAGIYHPDEGTIHFENIPTNIQNVSDANRLGIRVIHQELSLAPNLSIAENIFMGREPRRFGWLLRGRMDEDAARLIHELGLDEIRHVHKPVSSLSVAHKQLVEIARALSTAARVLILDEPTSSLSAAETDSLFVTLRRLRQQGVGIIYISHRLEEIIRLADRITVLRDGHSMGTQPTSDIDRMQLIKWMVGRDISDHFQRPACQPGELALEIRDMETDKIHGIDLDLHYGEILGVAGLVGAGRSELARAVFGIDPILSGTIRLDGATLSISRPKDALNAGIVLVPEDRRKEGLVTIQSVAFNIALPWLREWNRGVMPDKRKRNGIVSRAIDGFGIRLADPEQPVISLSGGNQQKTLVGRWMEKRPKVLILDEPTRGIDVGAREEMFGLIGSLVEAGMAVLLISSDLDETINLSHRVALMRDGTIVDTVMADKTSPEFVMTQLTGVRIREDS